MPLAPVRDTIPTATAEQLTHNQRVVSEISRIISGAVAQSDVQSLIDTAEYIGLTTKTGAYTLTASDNGKVVLVDTTAGAVTITLPASGAVSTGWHIRIKALGTASTNNVTINRNSNTIDGGTSNITLNTNYAMRHLIYTSTGAFNIIGTI
jgi:hypothetical protein